MICSLSATRALLAGSMKQSLMMEGPPRGWLTSEGVIRWQWRKHDTTVC
jgi:hypothetical protein